MIRLGRVTILGWFRILFAGGVTLSILAGGACVAFEAAASQETFGVGDSLSGIRLGETTDQLRASLGHPTLKGYNEHAVFWSYRTDHDRAWRVAIIQNDHVAGIYIRQAAGRTSSLTDGHGVAFNVSIARLFVLRGKTEPLVYSTYSYATTSGIYLLYEVTKAKITGIGITRWYDYPLPFLSTWDGRDGETFYRAVMLTKADGSIAAAEVRFLKNQSCDYSGSWHILTHTGLFFEHRTYDRVLATCSRSLFRHNFYFDTTNANGNAALSTD